LIRPFPIYTVERHPVYEPLLLPCWQRVQAGAVEVVASELTLLEALVAPLRQGDAALRAAYEQALFGTELRMVPVTLAILRLAADLRATGNLRTLDAIHAATAIEAGAMTLVSNDAVFRRVPAIAVVLLDELFP
jgi:predicted nucleic acid-binding protein